LNETVESKDEWLNLALAAAMSICLDGRLSRHKRIHYRRIWKKLYLLHDACSIS